MRAIVYTAPLRLELRDIDEPRPTAGETVVKVFAAGICGSELEGFASQSPMRVPPLVMGHEFAGVRTTDGARVVVNPLTSCGQCDLCTHDHPNLCRERRLLGIHAPGGFAERVAVPAANCIELPASLSFEQASMIEPIANAVHALRIADDPTWRQERIGVIGAGALGIAVILAASRHGPVDIEVADLVPERLTIAEAAGATPVGDRLSERLDLVIDCVGSPSTRAAALTALRPGGTAVWLGLHSEAAGIDAREVTRSEKRILGTFAYTPSDFRRAVDLASAVDPAWLAVESLDDGVEVFLRLLDSPSHAPRTVLVP
jgi:threonine dehydrogenase-like Zn-dependent dehydrogenase